MARGQTDPRLGASKNTGRAKAKAKRQRAKAKRQEGSSEKRGARKEQEFEANLEQAKGLASGDIQSYFTDRGLDPTQYQSAIDRAMQEVTLGIPKLAENIPGYFTDIAPNIYNELQDAAQTRALTDIERQYAPGFEQNLISNTADDSYIAEILASERAKADQYTQNLFDRGVVTPAGLTAAQGDIQGQEAKIRAMLDQLGGQALTTGREGLSDIWNEGRMAAGNLRLGQTFDPGQYSARINQALSDFSSGLGSNIRSLIPEGGLFQTTGLPARAGAAQGAQNTAFSPNALAGVFEEDEDRKAAPLSIF